MGSKGNNRHIKRLAASRYINIGRKVNPYVLKPNAGRHTLDSSIAISTVIKEKLGIAQNERESRRILNAGSVEVNGKVVKDPRFPIGFGDVISFKPSKEQFSIGVGRSGTITVSKAQWHHHDQPLKVVGKYIASSKKEMVRLYNGVIIPSVNGVSVNDSVMVKDGKIYKVIKLEKGAKCLVVKGVHASLEGTIAEIKKGTALRDATVEIHGKSGSTETLLGNIIVTGAK